MARLHQVVRRQGPCHQHRTVTQEEMVIRAMVFILWLVAVRSEAGTGTVRENSLLSSYPDKKDYFEMDQSVEESQRRLPMSNSQIRAQSHSSSGNSTVFRRSVRKARHAPLLRICSKRQLITSWKGIIKAISPKVRHLSSPIRSHISLINATNLLRLFLLAARQCEELISTDGSSIQRRDAGSLVRILLANLGTELSGEGRKRVASSAIKVEGGAAPEHEDGLD
ncbi:hypothetical protein N7478_010116 [Penicillium angulare]|uniref:uncharacterized protein n=1 Tax=Penicillium angulare TaxID=116970 RepID=UPI0025413232|nr:uncharacterized protein N7478_010116 [Penicillium angulare]KAJ5267308.1 hypothetical protein N7478_010116 [Penicillium angulare]